MLIKCSKCGKTKTNTQFSRQKYPGKTPRSRFNGWCKQCRIADSKKYYKEKGYTRSLNPLTRRFQYITAYLNHAGSTLKTTDIKELYAKQKGLCAYTGILMTLGERGKSPSAFQVSVDRIDPEKGYINGNIALCCLGINHLKARHSPQEMYEILFQLAEGAKWHQQFWQNTLPTQHLENVTTSIEMTKE